MFILSEMSWIERLIGRVSVQCSRCIFLIVDLAQWLLPKSHHRQHSHTDTDRSWKTHFLRYWFSHIKTLVRCPMVGTFLHVLWMDRENPSLCLGFQLRRQHCLSGKIQWPWPKEYSAFAPMEPGSSFQCPPQAGCQRKQIDCPIAELPRGTLSQTLVNGSSHWHHKPLGKHLDWSWLLSSWPYLTPQIPSFEPNLSTTPLKSTPA